MGGKGGREGEGTLEESVGKGKNGFTKNYRKIISFKFFLQDGRKAHDASSTLVGKCLEVQRPFCDRKT